MRKKRTINEKPTEASPETKEQFVLHESDIKNHELKFSSPPNCNISFGLARPHKFFKNKLTTRTMLKIDDVHKKRTAFSLNLKPK